MNPCICCGLELPPGASHASPTDCVQALRAVVEAGCKCRECGEPIAYPLHVKCVAKTAGRAGTSKLVDHVERKAVDAFTEWLTGGPGGKDKGDEPPRPRRRGGRWKP